MHISRNLAATCVCLFPLCAQACDAYDPPPEAELRLPALQFWSPSQPLVIAFTEPIDPDSLAFDVRPELRDREGNFLPEAVPILAECHIGACGALTSALTLETKDHVTTQLLTLTQNGAFDELEGQSLVLTVHAGLADLAGRTRKVPTELKFSINSCNPNDAPVDVKLESGVFSLTARVKNVLWLHLVLDLAVNPKTGRTIGVVTSADVKSGADQDAIAAGEFDINLSENGFARAFTARVSRSKSGALVLCSDPFDFALDYNDLIPLALSDFRIVGRLAPGANADGRDLGEGLLSARDAVLNDKSEGALTASWHGTSFRPEELPGALPDACAPEPCATLDPAFDCEMLDPRKLEAVCETAP